jgi:predicted naringenin-chalcone synthase
MTTSTRNVISTAAKPPSSTAWLHALSGYNLQPEDIHIIVFADQSGFF